MNRQLRTLASLSEDLGSILNTYMATHNFRGPDVPFLFTQAPNMYMVHIDVQAKHSYV